MKNLFSFLILCCLAITGWSQCSVSISAPQLSLCKGVTTTLQASSGFQSYFWSNGASGASIQVTKEGIYTVRATTASNCIAYASVNIVGLNKAAFTISGQVKCDTSAYTFINQSAIAVSSLARFKWLFGDGSSYTSSSPIVATDTAMWTNFQKKYTTNGTFIPKLILWYPNQTCIDTFTLDTSLETGVRAPANWSTFVYITLSQEPTGTMQVSKVCNGTVLHLKNAIPFPSDISGFSYSWSFADPNAIPPGSDIFINNPNPSYQYKQGGSYIPKLTIQCPNKPARTYNWYSRIDSINDNSGNASASPEIYTVQGFLFPQNQWMNRSRYVYKGNQRIDSLPTNWNLFSTLISDTLFKVKPSNLFGYGVAVSGIKATIENPIAGITIAPHMKFQIEGNFPVEFKNATSNVGGPALFNRWNFDDSFSPRCTAYSVPNPGTPNNGLPPYSSTLDQLNRTLPRFKHNGQVYNGRANCNNSTDTLPLHQYQTYTNLLRWHRFGIDFPPYDTSPTGWTTNLSQVTPGGKKYVHPLDQADWGSPKFAPGPSGARIDTMLGLYPNDILPNQPIVITQMIPDPIAAYKGFPGYFIPAGTSVDTAGLLNPPLQGILPDNTNRASYRGNTALPASTGFKDLYEYFFNRSIPSAYKATLNVSAVNICGSTDTVLLVSGKPDPCGIQIIRENHPYKYGATKFDFSMTWPPAPLRRLILMNYDSLNDRKDLTPCELDGFINFDGNSPMTASTITPGGLVYPALNENYNFPPFSVWTSPTRNVNRTHYINSGPHPYSHMPIDPQGRVTTGFIIGSGCATTACTSPAMVTDTLWYPEVVNFKPLNGNFNLRKKSGYAGYGKNGFLAGQDTSIGINLSNNEPMQWCRLYGKGDEMVPTFDNPNPEDLKYVAVNWGDGMLEVDSFNYNQKDTIIHFSGNNFLVQKGRYAYNRIHYIYSLGSNGLALKSTQVFPLGQGRVITTKFDTVYRCDDPTRSFPPQRIDVLSNVTDPSINLNHLTHKYQTNTLDALPNTDDLFDVQISMGSTNGDFFNASKYITLGYLNTFYPEKSKPIYLVNEPIKFIDSIRYFNPNTGGSPFGPNRPLEPTESIFSSKNAFRMGMAGYPLDTIKALPNPTKFYVTTGTSCPAGYLFKTGSPKTCIKIDTFFFERIYWDFESDGIIDYVGQTPIKTFSAPGDYLISMITRDSLGYFDTIKKSISVVACASFNPLPQSLASCNDSVLYLTLEPQFNLNNWYFSGSNIPIASNTLFFPITQDGKYRVASTNASGTCSYSDSVNAVFLNKVKIKQGSAITKCSNGSDTLVLEPTITNGFQFQWDGTVNQPKLLITKSEGVVKHILKISKNGADCFDSSITAFVEPLRVSPATANLCIRDSIMINVLSNTAFNSSLNLQWKKDSNDSYAAGGFSKVFVFSSLGIHKPMVRQNYEQCRDSFAYTLFADPTYVAPKISGANFAKVGDTVIYSTALVSGYTYSWVVSGGNILSGLGSNQIQVIWNATQPNGLVKVTRSAGICSDQDTLSISISSTGLSKREWLQDAVLYPNPSSQTLTFATNAKRTEEYSFQMLDMEGRVIESGVISASDLETRWDIAYLKSGIYFLRVTGKSGTGVYLWIKQ